MLNRRMIKYTFGLVLISIFSRASAVCSLAPNEDGLGKEKQCLFDSDACKKDSKNEIIGDGRKFNLEVDSHYHMFLYKGRVLHLWNMGGELTYDKRHRFWYKWEEAWARGRTKTNKFNTSGSRYGIEVSPFLVKGKDVFVSYETCRLGTGNFETSNSFAKLIAPSVDTAGLRYDRYQLIYSHASVPNASADIVGVGIGYPLYLLKSFPVELTGHIYYESASGADRSQKHFLSSVGAKASYSFYRKAKLNAEVQAFPSGLPYAGHPLASVSAVLLHEPNSTVEHLKRNFIVFLTLGLEMKI